MVMSTVVTLFMVTFSTLLYSWPLFYCSPTQLSIQVCIDVNRLRNYFHHCLYMLQCIVMEQNKYDDYVSIRCQFVTPPSWVCVLLDLHVALPLREWACAGQVPYTLCSTYGTNWT